MNKDLIEQIKNKMDFLENYLDNYKHENMLMSFHTIDNETNIRMYNSKFNSSFLVDIKVSPYIGVVYELNWNWVKGVTTNKKMEITEQIHSSIRFLSDNDEYIYTLINEIVKLKLNLV